MYACVCVCVCECVIAQQSLCLSACLFSPIESIPFRLLFMRVYKSLAVLLTFFAAPVLVATMCAPTFKVCDSVETPVTASVVSNDTASSTFSVPLTVVAVPVALISMAPPPSVIVPDVVARIYERVHHVCVCVCVCVCECVIAQQSLCLSSCLFSPQ